MAYDTVMTETHGPVRLIRLNRPEALNALSVQLIKDLNAALDEAEAAEEIRCNHKAAHGFISAQTGVRVPKSPRMILN